MKKYIIPLFLTCNIIFANDGGEQPTEQPNRFMQFLAAIASCPFVCFKSCSAPNRDPREKACLHNEYVAPYEVSQEYQNNNCCLLAHYFAPCCVPQQLAD